VKLNVNLYLGFVWGAVGLNSKLRKIVNRGNLTLRLFAWGHGNRTLN
jgi:hypothetical protein